MMRHGLLALALLVSASPLTAQTDVAGVREQVAAWWQDASRLAPGNWGIAVADERGEIIWSVEADQPLVPASTVKLFTTGFARSVLGSDARRATRVVGEGHLDRTTGQWKGTWALQMNGDVTLERGAGYGPSLYDLALQMHAQGIRRISGPFEVRSAEGSADATWPSAWAARHRGRLFAPLIGPLTLHENVVSFTVRPGARVGQRVRLTAAAPEGVGSLLRITARTVAGRRSRLRFLAQPDGSWLISGTLGVRAGARQYGATASKPQVVLRAVWASALERAGIEWMEKAAPGRDPGAPIQVLAEVTSPPLDSVASEVNRRSLNIGAELLLQWAAGRGPAAPAALTDHVRQVTGGDSPVHLVDGSGLSNEDRVAASTFVSYLARFPTTAAGRNFPLLLPANGSGTLRRLSALPESGVVRAKTGTLNQVSTVVGYLGRPGGVLIVSLMYNGRKTSAARRQQWELFRVLGADGVVIPAANDSTMEANIQLGGDGSPTPGPVPGPAGD